MPTDLQGLATILVQFGISVRAAIDDTRAASDTGNPLATKMHEQGAHKSMDNMLAHLQEPLGFYASEHPEEALPAFEVLAAFLEQEITEIHAYLAHKRQAAAANSATTTEANALTPLWQAPPPRVPDPHGGNAPEQLESVNFMAQRIFHVGAGFPGKAIRLLMERGITTFADIEEAGQGEMRRIFSEDPQIAGGIDSRMARAYEMGYAGTKYWDEAYHARQRETRGSTFAGGGGIS